VLRGNLRLARANLLNREQLRKNPAEVPSGCCTANCKLPQANLLWLELSNAVQLGNVQRVRCPLSQDVVGFASYCISTSETRPQTTWRFGGNRLCLDDRDTLRLVLLNHIKNVPLNPH